MPDHSEDISLAQAIGEVKGTLNLLLEMTRANNEQINRQNEQINRQIGDLKEVVDQRINDYKDENNQRFAQVEQRLIAVEEDLKNRENDGKKAIGSGTAAAVVASGLFEVFSKTLG